MSRIRFSMASLILGVAVFAITFAGLQAESGLWTKFLSTIVVFLLLISIVCAIYNQALRRAFWVGFAVAGWGYWMLAYGPGVPDSTRTGLLAIHVARDLTPIFQKQVTKTVPGSAGGVSMMGGGSMAPGGMGGAGSPAGQMASEMMRMPQPAPAQATRTITISVGPSFDQVITVCHCWLTILFAIAGAVVGRYVAGKHAPAALS